MISENVSFICKENCLPSLIIQTFLLCYRQEEMYQLLISNYEEKQQELRIENNDLRECLVHMQRELSAVLNNTDFSIMLQTRRNVPVTNLQL